MTGHVSKASLSKLVSQVPASYHQVAELWISYPYFF